MFKNPYDLYKQQDLETSNKQELVGKLYNEGSISLKRAIAFINDKKYFDANESIKKTEIIVKTLNKSLDMQYDISHQLRALYSYMLKRMVEGNLKKDTDILKEISDMLLELRDAWMEAVKRSKKLQSI